MEQQLQDAESGLRRHLDEGRNKFRNLDLGHDFKDAQLLGDAVQRDLRDSGYFPNARLANPFALALVDSGASNHMLG